MKPLCQWHGKQGRCRRVATVSAFTEDKRIHKYCRKHADLFSRSPNIEYWVKCPHCAGEFGVGALLVNILEGMKMLPRALWPFPTRFDEDDN